MLSEKHEEEFVIPLKTHSFALYPSAAQERLSEGIIADAFSIDVRHVRAMNSFVKDLLISRAIEAGYISPSWSPRSRHFAGILDELSRSILGHWAKLLTPIEREERRHVLFVIRVVRRQFNIEREITNV